MQDFRSLKVWQFSHELTLEIYQETRSFPREELFGLTVQLRRSASSVAANIAEGCGRGSDADFRRFLQMAMGSASETEYHILLSRDLGYFSAETYDRLVKQIESIKRMLASLIRKLSLPGTDPGTES